MSGKQSLVCYAATKISSPGIFEGANPLEYAFPLLLFQISLVFITTNVIYYIIRPFKQPRIVAEIVGGIILGPSCFGRNETFKRLVFPERGTSTLDTIAMFGLMYCVFIIGVKMDPVWLKRSGRKGFIIGLVGMITSMVITTFLTFAFRPYLSKGLKNVVVLAFLGSVLSLTSFAVLVPILTEIRLINSEMGRLAISSAMVTDIYGWFLLVTFAVMDAGRISSSRAVWCFISILIVVAMILYVIKPTTLWIVKNTPQGRNVEEIYIFLILVSVSIVGFFSELIGAKSYNGALVLGLVIPDGPPLGATVVEKLESTIVGLLLPFYFAMTGLKTDVYTVSIGTWGFVQLIIIMGWFAKLLGTLFPSLYFKIPFRDALSLSLVMNSKGIVEVVTYNHWIDLKVISEEIFTILILSTVIVTAIITPLIQILYEPSKRYIVYKRRNILHTRPDTELCILTCVHSQTNVPTIINILEASNPTTRSPIIVFAFHLVQLVGRAAPLLIPHKQLKHSSPSSMSASEGKSNGGMEDSKPIMKAFGIYEQQHEEGAIVVHPFTVIADYSTMHDDVCIVALHKNVALIIIPFHKQMRIDGGMDSHHSIRTLNNNILIHAPCSVGILVDQTFGNSFCTLSGIFSYNIAMLFFGGDDDREALAYVARMAKHPGVRVTIVRFFSSDSISDWSREKKIDSELFEEFKISNINNERVMCREVPVKDMEEIVSLMSSLTNEGYDLLIVGMRHDSNYLLAVTLNEWVEYPELGVVGGLLASPDFGTNVSVLVIRQQIHVRADVPNYYNQGVSSHDFTGLVHSSGLSPKKSSGLKFRSPLS